MVKNLPAVQETRVQSVIQEDPLEKGMAAHSGILVWRIPWKEESAPAAAAAKSLQSCPTLPIDGSPPGSLSLGFFKQEHQSGLPFPSPVHESEVAQSCLTQQPHGLQPTRLLHPWDFPGQSTGVGCGRLQFMGLQSWI